MKHSFYNVRLKTKEEVIIEGKIQYGTDDKPRYAFKSTGSDGTKLTAFVCKATWDKYDGPIITK
jgi:hypothetical protein